MCMVGLMVIYVVKKKNKGGKGVIGGWEWGGFVILKKVVGEDFILKVIFE